MTQRLGRLPTLGPDSSPMKFLPQRATVEQFGSGGFRFAGMSHQGSLLVLPSGMRVWRPARWADVKTEDFAGVLAELSNLDFLVIGTGETMQRPDPTLATFFNAQAIPADFMSTSSAIHTYNVMLAEDRRVAAAFIAVDKAHG